MRTIDFHTHAFPDSLAERAVPLLESETEDAKACLDGKLSSLLASMDRAGIAASVVASIATKPSQWESILRWSVSIASERIIPFASVHPADPEALDHLKAIREAGIRGIKLHPYYQEFDLDERRVYPIYETLQDMKMILLCHTGFDIAFDRFRRADPQRIRKVVGDFPGLILVTSHCGAWEDWDEVERLLLGRDITMDVSYSFPQMGREKARRFLLRHPKEHLLFGSDSPWADQEAAVAALLELGLEPDRLDAILFENARRLLNWDGSPELVPPV
jgi:predicted TIM-barrel fold metal-dependent hydrolase